MSSSVLRWPDSSAVVKSVVRWAERLGDNYSEVLRVGFFGSYARGDWGVGSDLDLVVIVDSSDRPFEARAALFDVTELPVPADLFVYNLEEWEHLSTHGGFLKTVEEGSVWVYRRERF